MLIAQLPPASHCARESHTEPLATEGALDFALVPRLIVAGLAGVTSFSGDDGVAFLFAVEAMRIGNA